MKPVRLPASATHALPRWGIFALCMLYILPGLWGRDPWKTDDAAGFGIMWTMAHGTLNDWLWPHIVGLPMPEQGPLAFWIGAVCIKLFGGLFGEAGAARIAVIGFFLLGSLSVWYATYLLGRRMEAQPLKLAFGGQPEPKDYGRTLADGALLIYLGFLGLLEQSHYTSAGALQVALIASAIYVAARFLESFSFTAAAGFGSVLGLLTLTRGWVVPFSLWVALAILTAIRNKEFTFRLMSVSLLLALMVSALWLYPCHLMRPFHSSPFDAWMNWNLRAIDWPSWEGVKYLLKNSSWFAWPAWPFAGWAVYAWRRQFNALHIALPLAFFMASTLLATINPYSEPGILLPLLPPLAILAAFGLPTMKRSAINAVDWFSVTTFTTCAGIIWLFWIAKQTGWPIVLARNALKLVPGFKPELNWIAFIVAALASVGWVALIHWRISRHPSVLWRAVVLSSGGVILCWLLLTTLWMPWGNYMKSYASVAQQIALKLPPGQPCVDSNVGPAQRSSFAYIGHIRFAQFDGASCDFLLLQDNNRKPGSITYIEPSNHQWQLLWEGHRPSDRDERFRLYRRLN